MDDELMKAIEDELGKWYDNEISYVPSTGQWMVTIWNRKGPSSTTRHTGHGDDLQDALNTALPNTLGRRVQV